MLPSKDGQKWTPEEVAKPKSVYVSFSAGASAQGVLPSKDGQKWTPEEVAELTRLVEEPAYLKEKLGLDKVGSSGSTAGQFSISCIL